MARTTRLWSIWSSERGNVLVTAAAVLPMLLGAAAFAMDTIQLALLKRELQRAADSGAIAGAHAVAQAADPEAAVDNDLQQNDFPDLNAPPLVQSGQRLGFGRAVHVRLTSDQALPFMSIFGVSPARIRAQATAAIVNEGEFCILSLHEGNQTGIDLDGSGSINFQCGAKTNSTSEQAVRVGGSSSLSATIVAAVGGLDGTRNNFGAGTRLQPHSGPQADPLAQLRNPPPQNCARGSAEGAGTVVGGGTQHGFLDEDYNLRTRPQADITITPGCYHSMVLKGTTRLMPGTYYIDGGDLTIEAQAQMIGDGVNIVLTGPGGDAGDLRVQGGAQLQLSPSAAGDYAGVLFYRDRRAARTEVQITGNSSSSLAGALYFPTADITFTGHAGMNVQCLQLIGQLLRFRGTADVSNECPSSSSSSFQQSVVRLVE